MSPIVLGCNHKTAPLALRETLTFDEARACALTDGLREEFGSCEVVVLSTCNRSEVYVSRPTHARPRKDDLIRAVGDFCDVSTDALAGHVYVYEGREAVGHLFRVVCSLDSMVVGETQILAQAKSALAAAERRGAVGKSLTTVFQWAFHVAKEARTETAISEGQVSVGSVAVRFARQIFADFRGRTVLMIGAGEMGKLTLRHVLEVGPARTIIANRTLERAERIAQRCRAEAVDLTNLSDHLGRADIVITSTGATEAVLTPPLVEAAQASRNYDPLLIVDIAVPRDVDPTVGEISNVYLYNIDDLQAVVDAGVEDRQEQAAEVDRIIAEHVAEFLQWRDTRAVGPVLEALRKRLSEISEAEANWATPKLSGDPSRDAEVLEQMLHRLMGKLLHGPSQVLREKAEDGSVGVYAETLRRMFDLKDDTDAG